MTYPARPGPSVAPHATPVAWEPDHGPSEEISSPAAPPSSVKAPRPGPDPAAGHGSGAAPSSPVSPASPAPLVGAPAATGVPPSAPALPGWDHHLSGKVRDVYVPAAHGPWAGHDVLLVVASDRISAYDHVLPTPVPGKGAVLTALTAWWLDQLSDIVPGHLLSLDVPEQVAGRAMVCQRLDMYPVECVARGYLTGSGLAEYRAHGTVCGIALPDGLGEASRLPEPVFTPAAKAALGSHDENITYEQVESLVGPGPAAGLRRTTLEVYARAAEVAHERGIILADTKLELGTDASGRLVLADEVLTPDSSRFWPADAWVPGQPTPSFDKQYVRDWLTSPASGWDPSSGQAPPPLPDDVVERTRQRYLEAYERLTGSPLAS